MNSNATSLQRGRMKSIMAKKKKETIEEKTELIRTYYDEDGSYVEVFDYPSIANGSRERGKNEFQVKISYRSPEHKEDVSHKVTEIASKMYMDWLYDLYLKEFSRYARYETFVKEWFQFHEENGKTKRDVILEWLN